MRFNALNAVLCAIAAVVMALVADFYASAGFLAGAIGWTSAVIWRERANAIDDAIRQHISDFDR